MTEQKKLCKYTVLVEDAPALLLYNTLNGSLLRLTEAQKIADAKRLFAQKKPDADMEPELLGALTRNQFVLPLHIDEGAMARYLFQESYAKCRTLSFLVYVTDACNFRCVYCPETHAPSVMSLETADQLCLEIERSLEAGDYDGVSLGWFGGEPLLELPLILRVMERLGRFCRERGLSLTGGATTNGYLLTEQAIPALLHVGVNQFQITLDGVAQTHDVTRPLAKGGGTWDTVWKNLLQLQKQPDAFVVNLRINANERNSHSAKQLIDLAHRELDDRFLITINPISNMGGDAACTEYCSIQEGQRIVLELSDYLDQKTGQGIGRVQEYLIPMGLLCNAARPNYYIVRTDGGISKCELNTHSPAAVLLDQLGSGSMDQALLAQYLTPSTGSCEACDLYPLCFGLICPHKRTLGIPCDYRDHFLLEENIRLLAKHLRRSSVERTGAGAN